MKTATMNTPPMAMAWFIWGLGAMFYLVAFFQRVAPGVMTEELMRDFNITAAGLGHLSALYFYPYLFMQIPTGIMADIFGPRKLLSAGCIIAGAGTLLFALSPDFIGAGIGRFFIGISVGVAFVGLLKLSSSWFPASFYAFVAGNALSIGLIGAIFAGPPLRYLIDTFDWRMVFCSTGVLTVILGLIIWVVVRDWPQEKGYTGFTSVKKNNEILSARQILVNLFTVLKYKNTLLLLVIPGGIVGATLTFSGLWGVPYLTSQYDFSPSVATRLNATLLFGWAFGGPVFGGLSGRLGSRKLLYLIGALGGAAGWYALLFFQIFSLFQLGIILFLTGFFSGCIIISFPFAAESVPRHLSGTVSGLTNMGIMAGPTVLQPIVGLLLDNRWSGEITNGVRVYTLDAYEYGFIPVMTWVILSVVLLLFTTETCKQDS